MLLPSHQEIRGSILGFAVFFSGELVHVLYGLAVSAF
jgi:hypothetical protein